MSLPLFTLAKKNWTLTEQEDGFFVQGECSGSGVSIDLFAKAEDSDPLYVFETQCENDEFYFSSNTLKNNIPEGDYIVAVNGEKNWNLVSMEKDVNSGSNSNPDVIFLVALAGLQQSLLDMQIGVSQTTYSSETRSSLEATLGGMQSMASKVAETLWSVDNPNTNPVGEVAGVMSEKQEENYPISENAQAQENQGVNQLKTLEESGIKKLEKQQVYDTGSIYMNIDSLEGLDFSDDN